MDLTPFQLKSFRYCFAGMGLLLVNNKFRVLCYLSLLQIGSAAMIQLCTGVDLPLSLLGFPLVIEMVNTAIERAVDHAGVEFSIFAREAKDIAAAASMSAQVLVAVEWCWTLFRGFYVLTGSSWSSLLYTLGSSISLIYVIFYVIGFK